MKYLVVVGDGMADYPIKELGGKTPLQVANTPNMDAVAARGISGTLKTIPEEMGAGSDVANLSILGYDPRKYYTGRGPLEAASIGVKMGSKDIAFRCNLITEKDGKLADYCADHISTEEAKELIDALNESYSDIGEFYAGVSYRHLFLLREADEDLICTPPHDVIGGAISDHLIKPRSSPIAEKLNDMILDSKNILSKHPINIEREKKGKNPANMIWLWGQGKRPQMETLAQKYSVKGAIVSAVDLIKGIGVYAGMSIINVPGATGYYDTNYEGKADYALKALEDHDYVYVHVEAIDEAAHAGDLEMKIKTIEDFDHRLLGRVLDRLEGEYKIAVLPDHFTPIKVRTHIKTPVPFSIYSSINEKDSVTEFNEIAAKRGRAGSLVGEEFMKLLLKKRP